MCIQSDMVCFLNDRETVCVVQDATKSTLGERLSIIVRPSNTVADLYNQISTQFQYVQFELAYVNGTDQISLNDVKEKTLLEAGFDFDETAKNILYIKPLHNKKSQVEVEIAIDACSYKENMHSNDDDMAVGASATSPTGVETSNIPIPPTLPMLEGVDAITSNYKSTIKLYSSPRPAVGYVGLVNQAMTCYLNSLLQALFMTPEFRNALYNWEFDGEGELKSIPYQLQKLFLNLQTSSKLAVETTDLTKSFGWDSTEAWQQHDIQELCRVMFDALEHKFKNTKQADLINHLYEGKMIDYVKCLECGTEKLREDTFLDIPLPVRPFGSAVAYGSIEEAMGAFVQHETLDGNNQYFCEKCNKKCDAHKGLKFSKFPYILTLHLKRFDFDYQTLHRIKLNDKVTFPQNLNLNGLLATNSGSHSVVTNGDSILSDRDSVESAIKVSDDCSTTDSGSALDDDGIGGASFVSSIHNNHHDLQEDDEGIDMSSSTDIKVLTSSNQLGPYVYELFAIMIHSGSASGGHYYAYIRDFDSSEWYCFNDQTVTTITQEDIQKSFGGGSTKAYYSGAYSSSTNAYMLMYRQVDNTRNINSIKTNEFPQHIEKLLQKLKDKEESDRKYKEQESGMQKLKIFCFNKKLQRLVDCKAYMINESTLEETLKEAYSRLKLENNVPIDRCRLVAYDATTENCEVSFEGRDKDEIGDIMAPFDRRELLLETREEGEEFEKYLPGGIFVRIYKVDLETSDFIGPTRVRCLSSSKIGELKQIVGEKLGLKASNLTLAILNFQSESRILDSDNTSVLKESIYVWSKVFVTEIKNDEVDTPIFKRLVERFDHIINLYFTVPKIDKETLESLSIPCYEPPTLPSTPKKGNAKADVDEVDALMLAKPTSNLTLNGTIDCRRVSPLNDVDCNSEDSSLSDGDRTLVESVPDELNHSNYSPYVSDHQMSSPEDGNASQLNNSDRAAKSAIRPFYFKYEDFTEPQFSSETESQRVIKVWVDKSMIVGKLKEHLESIIKVPQEYFKIIRMSTTLAETECTRMTEGLNTFKDGERLMIELGRVLRKGEYKLKMYYLNLSEVSDDTDKIPLLCEWIFRSGANVGETKREILAHISQLDTKYNIPYEQCRLRKKNCKNPSKVFMDDQKFDDAVSLTTHSEVILQDLRDNKSQVVDDYLDVVLFVKKWSPSKMVLEPYEEVTVKKNTEFKTLLSEISGIPAERIEYTKLNQSFFRNTISVVSIHSNLTWNSQAITQDDWPLNGPQDGHIYYYRDSEEKLKELTSEERRELNGRENSRIERLGSPSSTYSPRRERGLKIYLDSSPKKHDD